MLQNAFKLHSTTVQLNKLLDIANNPSVRKKNRKWTLREKPRWKAAETRRRNTTDIKSLFYKSVPYVLSTDFAPYRSSTVSLFVSSGCLPIGLLYFKAVSILMHDVLNNLSPRNISNLFSSANVIHTYSTRFSSAGNLYTKYSRLTHQIKSFSRRGVIIWNSIPPDLRKLSKSCFKNKMRHYLLQILNQEEDYVGIPTIMSDLQNVI